MKDGITLIAAEREEQISKRGYDAAHDASMNRERQLALMARLLIAFEGPISNEDYIWMRKPHHWVYKEVAEFCQRDYKERLVIAGALIAAEIDRITLNEKIAELINKQTNENEQI